MSENATVYDRAAYWSTECGWDHRHEACPQERCGCSCHKPESTDSESSKTLCPATHPAIDNGAPCIYLVGHGSVGIPHTTANGLFWQADPEATNSETTEREKS